MNNVQHTNLNKFIELVEQFRPFHSGPDQLWYFFINEKRSWHYIRVQKYQKNYYINVNGRDSYSTENPQSKAEVEPLAKKWCLHIKSWMHKVRKSPIEAAAQLLEKMPMNIRSGVILRRHVNSLLSDWYDFERIFSAKELKQLITILERPKPNPLPKMSMARYMEYCQVAYQANPQTFKDYDFKKGLTGFEYYKRFADGRHGGLLELNPTSEQGFSNWYHSGKWHGCHPWEIYRGGNATHIDLHISEASQGGWNIVLDAFASSRLVETCRIALAFDRAGFPFVMSHAESYVKRLQGEDWVGIIPHWWGLSYAWQDFPHEWNVADCIHLDWLFENIDAKKKRHLKKQLRHIIQWLPEEISCWLKT